MTRRILSRKPLIALAGALVAAAMLTGIAYASHTVYGTIGTSRGNINVTVEDWFPTGSTFAGTTYNTAPYSYANWAQVNLYDYCSVGGTTYIDSSQGTQYLTNSSASGAASGSYNIGCGSGHYYIVNTNHEIQGSSGGAWQGGSVNHND